MICRIALFLLAAGIAGQCHARLWTDASGKYTLEADLIARDDQRVVLQRGDHHLVEVPVKDLSKQDQQYLASQEAQKAVNDVAGAMQTWTTIGGLEFEGRIVDYFDREVTIQRRRGKLYVLDRVYENLPEIYQRILRKVIEHFENVELPEPADLERWVLRQKGEVRTFSCQGVVVELQNGDEYAVPFFLFAQPDLALLQPGWNDWIGAQENEQARTDSAFRVQSLAAAHYRDQQVQQQIAKLQILSSAVQAGATDLWEVTLFPGPATGGPPIWVVVPGRNSGQAIQGALANNPGYQAGPARRVSR